MALADLNQICGSGFAS